MGLQKMVESPTSFNQPKNPSHMLEPAGKLGEHDRVMDTLVEKKKMS